MCTLGVRRYEGFPDTVVVDGCGVLAFFDTSALVYEYRSTSEIFLDMAGEGSRKGIGSWLGVGRLRYYSD